MWWLSIEWVTAMKGLLFPQWVSDQHDQLMFQGKMFASLFVLREQFQLSVTCFWSYLLCARRVKLLEKREWKLWERVGAWKEWKKELDYLVTRTFRILFWRWNPVLFSNWSDRVVGKKVFPDWQDRQEVQKWTSGAIIDTWWWRHVCPIKIWWGQRKYRKKMTTIGAEWMWLERDGIKGGKKRKNSLCDDELMKVTSFPSLSIVLSATALSSLLDLSFNINLICRRRKK